MKSTWPILTLIAAMLVVLFGGYYWMSQQGLDEKEHFSGTAGKATSSTGSGAAATMPATQQMSPLRLGVIPEQNVFELRERYRALQEYLSSQLDRPVEVVIVNTYQAILDDFSEKKIDAAFLGSLVTVLAMDRLDAKVLLKTVMIGGDPTYKGVVFVMEDSPIQTCKDLAGRSVGMVRTTTGGNLFPFYWMQNEGVLESANPPKIVWIGGHDEVIRSVAEGKLEVGAVKNTWLDAYDRSNAKPRMRRLAVSEAVPNNALVVRADLARELGPRLSQVLLGMDRDPRGKKALATYKAERFVPCEPREYQVIYEMIGKIGSHWEKLDIPGSPPQCRAQ